MRNESKGVVLPPIKYEEIEGLEVRELPPVQGLVEFKSAGEEMCSTCGLFLGGCGKCHM